MSAALGPSPGHASNVGVYRRLLRHVAPYWRIFLLATFGLIVFGATDPTIAALMKPMLDGSFVDRDPTVIKLIPLAIVGLALARMLSGFVQQYAMEWVARRVIKDLRTQMFEHLLRLPAAFFNANAAGNLISKVTYDVEQLASACSDAISVLIRDTVTIVLLLGWMFWINWKLALIFVLAGPLIAATVGYLSKRFRRLSGKLQSSMGGITHATEEMIHGHLVTKVFGGQADESRGFVDLIEDNRQLRMKWTMADSLGSNLVLLLVTLTLAASIYAAATFAANDRTTVGGFVSFMLAMGMMQSPIKRLMRTNSALQRGITAAHSVFGLLDENPEPDTGTRTLDRAIGAVAYRDVRFRYNPQQAEALKGISFTAEPGQTIAFVGPSGGGKSTLVGLLPRFYNPLAGAVCLDGQDVRELTLESLRRQIGLVSQNVVLFNDTVANNIAYGQRGEVTRGQLERVAEMAHAMDFIRDLPSGLDSRIGDNGVMLSGGQRQRIAIARAMLKDAPVLILDEATASLDTESEMHIQAALETLMQRRTTLVIAHRLSTIERADNILVIDNGEIVEQGRHGELIRHGGLYARLHRLQFGDARVAI